MNENKDLFEKTPVPRALATLAIPTIISQLITMIYNLADTFFIGMTDDPYKVAASSLVAILFFIMNSFANLFGVGGGSQLSRLLGVGRDEEAKRVCAFSFYGTLAIAILYSIASWILATPLLTALGASVNTMDYCQSYMFWVVVVGGVPATLGMAMSHLLRSAGYAKQASLGLGLGGVLNILLDPLFMFVILPPGNEVTGAAIATMLSNVVALVYFAVCFCRLRKRSVLSASLRSAKPDSESIRATFAVGLPSALSSLLACLSNGIKNSLAAGFGDIPLAAVGIVVKIDMLPLNVGMGLCQGMMPLVAYNYASGNYKRMKAFTRATQLAGMAVAGICIVAFQLFTKGIISLFIGDAATISYGTDFLRIACLATPFIFMNFQQTFCLQAMNKGKESLLLSICRQGVVFIPTLYIMRYFGGLYGVVWAQVISDAITCVVAMVIYARVCKKLPKEITA